MLPPSLRTRLVVVLAGSFTVILAGGVALLAWWEPPAGTEAPGWLVPAVALAELVALVVVADYVVQRFVLRPLGRMASDAREIAGGEVGHRVRETGPREIRHLGRAVNRMADRLVEDREELARNVASLQEVNRALTEARDELIQAEKLASVGRMAAGLAHEIGNPLNSVMTYVDVGRRRGVEGDWLDGIREEAGRIDEIIRGLLDFARPGDPVVDRHDANEIVRETLSLLESQGRFGEVEVEDRLAAPLPQVWVSPVRLEQVLVNLLLNAVDAMEDVEGRRAVVVASRSEEYEGPPGVQERIRRSDDPEEVDYSHLRRYRSEPSPLADHTLEPGERVVVLEVRDTGPGLEADPPEKVFDPFYTTKDPGRGTGLGLAVSSRLVGRMGGTMEVEEIEATGEAVDGGEVGGTCFRVILPTRRPPSREERSTAREEGRPRRPLDDGEAMVSSREERA